jgi:SPP1 gp7 family putative phage head morphogenesis protein
MPIYYYGTSSAFEDAIKRNGITPGLGRSIFDEARAAGVTLVAKSLLDHSSVLLTRDPGMARNYANWTSEIAGGDPLVLRVDLSNTQAKTLVADVTDPNGVRFKGQIKPRKLLTRTPPAPLSVNEMFRDLITVRTVNLDRFSAFQRIRIVNMLKGLERELIAALEKHDPTSLSSASRREARLQKLLRETQTTIRTAYVNIAGTHIKELRSLGEVEVAWTVNSINDLVRAPVMSSSLTAADLKALSNDMLVNGGRSKEWWSRQAAQLRNRFNDSVRQGVLQGEGVDALTRRVKGTKAMEYRDGIMNIPRNQAEALVRTSVQNYANAVRMEVYKENTDVVDAIQWVSTLDARTTLICINLDGLQWTLPNYDPVQHAEPYPGETAHWNCRSTQVGVIKGFDELGKGRSITTGAGGRSDLESMYQKELSKLGVPPSQARKAFFNTRASIDGQVARGTNYEKWIGGKSEAFQNKVFGKGRAELWRQGKISVRDMVDQSGRPIPLKNLIG